MQYRSFMALFPNIYDFLRKPPPLSIPKTDYEIARHKVIGVGRMLQHCGSRANPKSPPHEIHEVCYAFICQLKTYYPNISVNNVHTDAEDPQIDKYMDAKTRSEYKHSFRHQWKPKIRHETTPEPMRKGFGSKPPWAAKEATSTAKPPSPPPVPPVSSELPPRFETMSAAHLRGLGRGTATAYPTSSNQPTMPHPKGTRPGPQPDDFAKGIPDIGVAFINAEPKPSKTHPCLVYGEQDIQRATRPYASPYMPSSVMWKSDGTLTIDDLKQRCPHHHEHLLKRLCYNAEISCRTMSTSDVPCTWYHEVQYLENPHHPLLNQRVPPIFLMRFLQHSLQLPKLLYEANAPFIAPLIPWEFSRDTFLPRRKHPDYDLVDEYDKAWASVRAITHHLQLVCQNSDIPRKQGETEDDYEYHCRCLETNRGFSYMPSLLAQAYVEACQPAGFPFDITLLRPFTDSYGVHVHPYMPICVITGSECQLMPVEDCFVTDSVCHPVAFSGREWGAPLSDEIINLWRNLRRPSVTLFRDLRGFSRGDPLACKEPPLRYADINNQEVWYYDGLETYLEDLPGDGNFEKPWRPYPYGLDCSPASCLEAHLTWRATFHSYNKTTIESYKQ